jgi:tetratricopeptide (TPR) repeat protein
MKLRHIVMVLMFAPGTALAADKIGWVPAKLLEKPVTLARDIGNATEKVSTASKDAQAFYDQGLNYLHSYVWIEAARSFNQALRADPNLMMAWVGLSRAYSGLVDQAAARIALETARQLQDKASPAERTRFKLRDLQLQAIAAPTDAAKFMAYKTALDDALGADMKNVELWLLRGNAEEPSPAGRGQRGGAGSIAFYKQALALQPDSSAAHHFLVHSFETIGSIDEALVHGETYSRLAAAIPHAWHMWGHDLRRGGKIAQAVEVFTKADELERAYYAKEGIAPGLDWHHAHNSDLLAGSYQYMGQVKKAEELFQHVHHMDAPEEFSESNKIYLINFYLARSRWNNALAAARPLTSSKFEAIAAYGHALSGQALIGLGRDAEAAKSADAAVTALTKFDKGLVIPARPHVDVLRGLLKLRAEQSETTRAVFVNLIADLRAAQGPDPWIQALFNLENIARMARNVGDWELARIATENMLAHDPDYAGGHYAAALLAERKGDKVAAKAAFTRAAQLWTAADADFPEKLDIQKRLAAL